MIGDARVRKVRRATWDDEKQRGYYSHTIHWGEMMPGFDMNAKPSVADEQRRKCMRNLLINTNKNKQ